MTRFQFRLERVLHWRGVELTAEETKLKRLMQEAAAIDARVEALQRALAQIPHQIAALEGLNGSDLGSISAYSQHLTRERGRALERRREKQAEVTKQAEVHLAAKQRYKLLEELRSRRFNEWQRATNAELDLLAHESYLTRWNSRSQA